MRIGRHISELTTVESEAPLETRIRPLQLRTFFVDMSTWTLRQERDAKFGTVHHRALLRII